MHEEEYSRLPGALLPWYAANRRDLPWRREPAPYRVWISEIMLQQTRVEAVLGYYARFLAALPTVKDLAEADEQQLYKLWEGLGYYSRVRNLKKAAVQIMERHGGVFPDTYEEIRALAGIGPYTAGAIASICFGLPRAAVDGNVLRIAARITGDDAPIDLQKTRAGIAAGLEAVYPAGACGDFTQALMELGATVCLPRNPRCAACPAAGFCRANAAGIQTKLPVRLPKKARREEIWTVFMLVCDDRIALCRRPPEGLLAGMWQLPNVPGVLEPEAAMEAARQMGVGPDRPEWVVKRPHIFTHVRWEMTCYRIRCTVCADGFTWVTPAEMQADYGLPTAFRQFFEE